MTLTSDELVSARSWLGDKDDEDTLHEAFDRIYNLDPSVPREEALFLMVDERLRYYLANLLNEPSSVSAQGMSISNVQNIASFRQMISDLRSNGLGMKGAGGARVTKLRRAETR